MVGEDHLTGAFGRGSEECSAPAPGRGIVGTVIKLWYHGCSFEKEYVVPYQVKLDIGHCIFAPVDSDECIRKSSIPPPSCWICFDDVQSETNLIVRECACRGQNNGFVHVNCLVKLALSRLDVHTPPKEDATLAFCFCITCKQAYDTGSFCHAALAKAFYSVCSDLPIDNVYNKMATTIIKQTSLAGGNT